MPTISRTIREQVTEQIRDDLIAGRIPAGQPLREVDLAKRFGVSRGPVRDAFLQLTQEGFLAYQANCGVTVRELPNAAHRDFFMSLRRQIEQFVIRQGFSQLNTDHFDQWDEIIERMRSACRRKDVAAIARSDVELHQAILTAAGGEGFLPMWKWLCSQMLLTYSRVQNFQQIVREHVDIVEAFRQGSLPKVLVALEKNLQ